MTMVITFLLSIKQPSLWGISNHVMSVFLLIQMIFFPANQKFATNQSLNLFQRRANVVPRQYRILYSATKYDIYFDSESSLETKSALFSLLMLVNTLSSKTLPTPTHCDCTFLLFFISSIFEHVSNWVTFHSEALLVVAWKQFFWHIKFQVDNW